MIIAVDFDGTIAGNDFPHIKSLQPGAIRVLKRLKKSGNTLVLWTCRSGRELQDAKKLLKSSGVEFDYFNQNTKEMVAEGLRSPKIYYDVLIDDRNLGGFPGWAYVEMILIK